MDDTRRSCREFVDILASDAPAPGGGGAAALAGALGAALGHMVGALTVGREKYAPVEEEMKTLMAECERLQEQLLDQVRADAEGFMPLAAAYKLPKDDPSRQAQMDQAAIAACQVPMRIMLLCGRALECLQSFARDGSRLAVSDAGCGAVLVKAAMQAASVNVFINTKVLSCRETAAEWNRKCLELRKKYEPMADEIFLSVQKALIK